MELPEDDRNEEIETPAFSELPPLLKLMFSHLRGHNLSTPGRERTYYQNPQRCYIIDITHTASEATSIPLERLCILGASALEVGVGIFPHVLSSILSYVVLRWFPKLNLQIHPSFRLTAVLGNVIHLHFDIKWWPHTGFQNEFFPKILLSTFSGQIRTIPKPELRSFGRDSFTHHQLRWPRMKSGQVVMVNSTGEHWTPIIKLVFHKRSPTPKFKTKETQIHQTSFLSNIFAWDNSACFGSQPKQTLPRSKPMGTGLIVPFYRREIGLIYHPSSNNVVLCCKHTA